MRDDGREEKPLPTLQEGMLWWIIESERFNLRQQKSFRIFEAVIGRNRDEAIQHSEISDELLDRELMANAIRRSEISDKSKWIPISRLTAHLAVARVQTEAEVAALDGELFEMLTEHDFFLNEFRQDPRMAVGGGVHPVTVR